MLSKLTKYELMGTGRVLLPMYGALLILGVVVRLFTGNGNSEALQMPQWLELMSVLSVMAYTAVMVAVFVLTFIVLVQRFYKNLLGDEGYLMFTLPVPTWKLVISKMLAALLWCVVSMAVAVLSGFLIVVNGAFFSELGDVLRVLISMLNDINVWKVLWLCFSLLIMMLAIGAGEVLNLYAAMAVGHIFHRHKLLWSFGVYLIMQMVSVWVVDIIGTVLGYSGFVDAVVRWGESLYRIDAAIVAVWGMTAFALVGAVVYFVITQLALNRKLNLE
ncbi:MAG: hypothetical protein ACOX7F_06855 [Eubacteriales bacterium]|jgi:hypothetical protein